MSRHSTGFRQNNFTARCIIGDRREKLSPQTIHVCKEGIQMNQSIRITEKTLRIALIVGSIVLVATILILSIAVGAARQREAKTAPVLTHRTVATTTAPSTEANSKPAPAPVKEPFLLTKPVEGYLLSVHDTEKLTFSPTMQDYRIHTGIDIEAEAGAAVAAAAAGTITAAYVDPMMGYTVEISHGDGFVTVYKNLDEILPDGIAVGVNVKAGQLIGAVGDSAMVEQSDVPHLHFELTHNAEAIDPLIYLTYTERAEE